MLNKNVTQFKENMSQLIEQTIQYNETISINTEKGNAILLSEEDYNGLMETVYLSSVPHLKEEIIEGMKTPLSECIKHDAVKW